MKSLSVFTAFGLFLGSTALGHAPALANSLIPKQMTPTIAPPVGVAAPVEVAPDPAPVTVPVAPEPRLADSCVNLPDGGAFSNGVSAFSKSQRFYYDYNSADDKERAQQEIAEIRKEFDIALDGFVNRCGLGELYTITTGPYAQTSAEIKKAVFVAGGRDAQGSYLDIRTPVAVCVCPVAGASISADFFLDNVNKNYEFKITYLKTLQNQTFSILSSFSYQLTEDGRFAFLGSMLSK